MVGEMWHIYSDAHGWEMARGGRCGETSSSVSSGRVYYVNSVDSGEGRDWPVRRGATRAHSGAAVHRHSLLRLNAIHD